MESQGLLLYERMQHFSNEMKSEILSEKELEKKEEAKLALFQDVKSETHLGSGLSAELLSAELLKELKEAIFLPDHLEWGCKTGFVLLPVYAKPLQSSILLRSTYFELDNQQKIKLLPAMKLKPNQPSVIEGVSKVYVGAPKIKYPITAYPGFIDFLKKYQKRHPMIYNLAKKGEDCHGVLYQLDANTGEEMFAYPLPCSIMKGSIIVEDVYYANEWHSVLLIESLEKNGKPNPLFLFDVTVPGLKQKTMRSITLPNFTMLAPPKIVRTKMGFFGILVGGKVEDKIGGIRFLPLDPQTKEMKEAKELEIKIANNEGIVNLLPIDLFSSGSLDRIYAVDQTGMLFSIDWLGRSVIEWLGKIKSLTPTLTEYDRLRSSSSKIWVTKSVDKPGIEFLTLEHKSDESNEIIRLFNQESRQTYNTNSGGVGKLEKQILVAGKFLDFYLFTNCLVVIPQSSSQNPIIMMRSRKGYYEIPSEWRNVSSGQTILKQDGVLVKKRIQSDCYWDLRQDSIQIITLDEDGTLNKLELLLPFHNTSMKWENRVQKMNRAARVMWRKTSI